MAEFRSPMLLIRKDPVGLNMVREKPYKGICVLSRKRSILFMAVLFFSGIFALFYIQTVTGIAGINRTPIIRGGINTIVKDDLSKFILSTTDDVNVYTGNDARKMSSDGFLRFKENLSATNSKNFLPDVRVGKPYITTTSRQSTPAASNSRCVKKRNVSFLKVHKAGSTTMMNIFLRFAIQNNLNIVLPARSSGYGFNYLGYGKTVSKENIVPLPANEIYNILCNHVVYNKSAFRSLMPDNTAYIGIIREPKSHFVSASMYYGLYLNLKQYTKEHNMSTNVNIMSEYLRNPTKYPFGSYFTHNRMSFDFGVPQAKFSDFDYIDKYFNELNQDYALIMVMERFAESLILMKRTLCWTAKDILYIPLNSRGDKKLLNFTDTDLENLRKWNNADFKLYEKIYNVFNKLVANAGPDFQDEVEYFQEIRERVEQFCKSISGKRDEATQGLQFGATKWSEGFVIGSVDCDLMTEAELPMMKRLITQAWGRYDTWKNSTRNTVS